MLNFNRKVCSLNSCQSIVLEWQYKLWGERESDHQPSSYRTPTEPLRFTSVWVNVRYPFVLKSFVKTNSSQVNVTIVLIQKNWTNAVYLKDLFKIYRWINSDVKHLSALSSDFFRKIKPGNATCSSWTWGSRNVDIVKQY